MAEEQNYYAIGKVSELCNVSIKTLRYYDDIGLLVPEYRKKESNYRYYTHNQILTLFIIRKLRDLGVSLKEIQVIITNSEPKSMEESITKRLTEIQSMIDDLNNQYAEGKILLDRLLKGYDLLEGKMERIAEDITVEEIPVVHTLVTRKVEKNYKNSNVSLNRWFELFQTASQNDLRIVGTVILTYHNHPMDQFFKKECDLEVAVQIDHASELSEYKTFGGFKAVTALHIGRNEEIIQTHIKMIKWLNQEGYTIDGNISEEYIISPVDIVNEEHHITKIIIPIKK